jgi:hypothetical protein
MSDLPPDPRGSRESRTPRFLTDEERFLRQLRMVRSDRLRDVVHDRREEHARLDKKVRQVRYEECAIAVELIYAIRDDNRVRDRFQEVYEQEFRREPDEGRLNREAFLLLCGETRKDQAGTDAMSLSEAIRREIEPERIPAYIKAKGGLQRLLETERRRRDPLDSMEVGIWRSLIKHLDGLEPGATAEVVVRRSWSDPAPATKFAIIKVRPRKA